ncbi:MAG TPA: helix-turn-helix transcriptional regulator [Chthoniobacter sp.]
MADLRLRNIVGPQIRRLRYDLKISQADLVVRCQRLGWDISRDILARIELQIRWVGDYELVLLAEALRVDIEELLPSKHAFSMLKPKLIGRHG